MDAKAQLQMFGKSDFVEACRTMFENESKKDIGMCAMSYCSNIQTIIGEMGRRDEATMEQIRTDLNCVKYLIEELRRR